MSANRTHTELVFMRMAAIKQRANLCLLEHAHGYPDLHPCPCECSHNPG